MATNKTKTAIYTWEGTNRRGQTLKGELSGQNMAAIKAALRKQGIAPKKIKRAAQPIFGIGAGPKKKKITTQDLSFFTRQMATMVKAGVPLVQSFDIVADGADNISLKEVIYKIRDSVASGNEFAASLRQFPQYFDELTCNLVEAGEQAGTLETMLDRIAIYKEKSEELKARIKKAMMYPVITLLVAFAVTLILLIKVIPSFQSIFADFGAELPAPTQIVIGLSEITQQYYLLVLASVGIAAVVFFQGMKTSDEFRDKVQAFSLKVPVFGNIIEKAAIARYARVLSTTFAAGVPLVDALDAVARAVGNSVYRDAVYQIRDDVSTGQQMHMSMRASKIFPNMVIQMTSIGEESGALDNMLEKAATHYESEVDNAVDSMTALIEPGIMVFLGVVIGGLIIAMYLPIFQLGSVV